MCDQQFGPSLPPNWKTITSTECQSQVIGPQLPPNLMITNNNESTHRRIGPTLPPNIANNVYNDVNQDDDSDSDDIIGPIPDSHKDFDKHNDKFANNPSFSDLSRKRNDSEVAKREEWMTEIPKPLARKLGMKNVVQFSQRSSKSIDKNAEKSERQKYQKETEDLDQLVDSYNKINKRNVSLIETHNEKMKKRKSEHKCQERVPFDSEKDLKSVRKLDSRQMRSVMEKAQAFSDRFSKGNKKFL